MALTSTFYGNNIYGKKKKKKPKKVKKRAFGYKCGPVTIIQTSPTDFLQSRAWFELRYKALLKYGAKCQCCGRSRKDNIIIHVDHIKPRSRYPALALDINNLQILCNECNLGKSYTDSTDWR